MALLLTIAQVSAETGIGKEVLRKWETRYGFPLPERNELGKRGYSTAQVNRLKLVKQLLNSGHRPAQLLALDDAGLQTLLAATDGPTPEVRENHEAREVMGWIKSRNPALLRDRLRQAIGERGMGPFVRELMPLVNLAVGEAWASNEIAVRDEHLYSEIVQGVLREALSQAVNPSGTPRVLLTTVPGEAHGLGILMLETVLSLEQAYCISLGPQSPLPEIVSAVTDYQADVVALSFSASYPRRQLAPLLKSLRGELPAHVKLWAGGAGTLGLEHTPRGVKLLASLEEACEQLAACRS